MVRMTDLIFELIDEESDAAKNAKRMGLVSKGFGRWADRSGQITHKTQNGKIIPISKSPSTPGTSKFGKANLPLSAPKKDIGGKGVKDTRPTASVPDKSTGVNRTVQKDAPVNHIPKQAASAPKVSNPKGTTPAKSTTPEPKPTATHPYKKTGNVYRSVSDSIESSGFSAMNSADSKALIKNGMVPLRVNGPAPRTWTRGDGAKHKEWTTIEPANDWRGVDKVVKKDPSAVSKTLSSYIEKIGAKQIGQVSGEFGSSKMNDVYAAGDTIFVHRGNRIDVGNKKRFANTKVWRKP